MPILLYCPDCSAKIRAPEQVLGRQVRCPKCDAEFTAASDGAGGAAPPGTDAYPVSQPAAPPREEPVSPPPSPLQELRAESTAPAAPPPEPAPAKEPEAPREPALAPAEAGPPGNPVVDFLLFRTMIAPLIIQIVFWVGVLSCVLAGFVFLVIAIGEIINGRQVMDGVVRAFAALAVILVGPLVVRIYCELLILFFRIYDTLREILAAAERQRRQG